MKPGLKTLLLLMGGTALAGCAANPTKYSKFDHSIADRALEVNEAFYSELNGQILKNILRARDRQPRFYTSMSDLGIDPQVTHTDKLGLGSIKLGNPGGDALNPWGLLGGDRTIATVNKASLQISPKGTEDGKNISIYHEPISINTFLTYYNDWHQNVVDNLMIGKLNKIDPKIYIPDEKDKLVSHKVPPNEIIGKISTSGYFQVFLDSTLDGESSDPKLEERYEILGGYYCFSKKDCKEMKKKPLSTNKTVKPETQSTNVTKSNYALNKEVFRANIHSYKKNLNKYKNKQINLRDGKLFVCDQEVVKYSYQKGVITDLEKALSSATKAAEAAVKAGEASIGVTSAIRSESSDSIETSDNINDQIIVVYKAMANADEAYKKTKKIYDDHNQALELKPLYDIALQAANSARETMDATQSPNSADAVRKATLSAMAAYSALQKAKAEGDKIDNYIRGDAVKFDCYEASSYQGIADPKKTSLVYVTSGQAIFPNEEGIYTIELNSIDNMIFRVGAMLSSNGGWEVKLNSTKFFNVAKYENIENAKVCTKKYAARIVHQGEHYLAGPPKNDKNNKNKYRYKAACGDDDNSATVLTLIGEIIKLRELNVELRNQISFTGIN